MVHTRLSSRTLAAALIKRWLQKNEICSKLFNLLFLLTSLSNLVKPEKSRKLQHPNLSFQPPPTLYVYVMFSTAILTCSISQEVIF